MEEKRKHLRLDLPVKVNYRPLEREGLEEGVESRDISEGGLSILMDRRIQLTDGLGLRIVLPQESGAVCAEGRIAWSKELPDKNIAGVQFTQISRFDRARLIRFIYAKKETLLLKSQAKQVLFLKEIPLQDKEELLRLIIELGGELEAGLRFLDKNVQLGQDIEALDLLAVDAGGQLVIAEVTLNADEGILLVALKHLDWVLRNGELLRKLYPDAIDFLQRPRIYLIGRAFSDSFKRQLSHLKPINIQTIEYRCFMTSEGRKGLWFNLSQEIRQLPMSEASPQITEEASLIAPPILDMPDVDEQRKRIIRWLWRKG